MRTSSVLSMFYALVCALAIVIAVPLASGQSQGRFVPPHADRGVDTDGDGLFNLLRVDVHVGTSVPGSFRLYADLYDGTNTTYVDSAFAFRTISGPTVIPIDFVGFLIRNSGMAGPYQVNLALYDDAFNLNDWNQHTTQAYSPAQFQRPPATLAPPHSDASEDRDTPPDGLYDVLRVDVRLNVSQAGIYTVAGQLWDPARSSTVANSYRVAALNPGLRTVSLFFPGVSIQASGLNGPYPVDLYVFGLSSGRSEITDQGTYTTGSYSASQFQPPTATAFGGVLDESSNPIPFALVNAYNYRDDVLISSEADAFGFYSFGLYPGNWIFTFDDVDRQAQLQRITLVAGPNFVPYLYLSATAADPVTTSVTFASWKNVEERVVNVGVADNATFRLTFDWEVGNRDQTLTLDEWNRLQPYLGSVPPTANDTREALVVDGTAYDIVSGSDSVAYPNLEGPVDEPLAPRFEQNASYASTLGPSSSRSVALNVTYDTGFANYAYVVQLPPFYALASFTSAPSVVVTGVGGRIASVDPGPAPSPGVESAWITLVANATDSAPPTITLVTATPNPVEIHQPTAIDASVTDDHGVGAVNVEVRDASGISVGNFTMSQTTGDTYEYLFSPATVGTATFQVTALDIAGNTATALGSLVSRDTTRPTVNAGPDITAAQHTVVTFDGSGSSDNDRIANYTWTFTDNGVISLYGASPTHRFDRPGTFTVTLAVRDPSGLTATDELQVTVTPTTATIRGTVRDESGAPLRSANVRLLSGSTEVASMTTNATGVYSFPDVAPGTYTVRVEMGGFDPKIETVTVAAGDTATKDITLTRTSPLLAWAVPGVILVAVLLVVLGTAVYALRRRGRKRLTEEKPEGPGEKS
ncbi:MAG: PKD domain-containing protein [Methanobacteriota archaeon]|nr:MAG: PKD domain-containing protein [Euryarchaeota archaeon]